MLGEVSDISTTEVTDTTSDEERANLPSSNGHKTSAATDRGVAASRIVSKISGFDGNSKQPA